MPHIISEAGAARLPVVATRDNGSLEQIEDGVSDLFVSHEAPQEVAARLVELLDDEALRACLGDNLRRKVEREYSAEAVTKKWEEVFAKVTNEMWGRSLSSPSLLFLLRCTCATLSQQLQGEDKLSPYIRLFIYRVLVCLLPTASTLFQIVVCNPSSDLESGV